MTKFAILSDLHLEYNQELRIHESFFSDNSETTLLIPGDISNNPFDIISLFSKIHRSFRQIIFIMGNHELYNDVGYNANILRYSKIQKKFDNVVFLHNDFIQIDSTLIHGGIGFTKIEDSTKTSEILKACNSFRKIGYATKHFWNTEHNKYIESLERTFSNSIVRKKIAISHFPMNSISELPMLCEFSNYDKLFEKLNIDVHVSGHIHNNVISVKNGKTLSINSAEPTHKFMEFEL